MANPRRVDADDFFAQLPEYQRPHLGVLRELSLTADRRIEEVLHWNLPAYLLDGTRQWILQAYKQHCSLRFPTRFFADHVAEVEAAGFFAGEGFVKIPYDRGLPEELCKRLIRARLDEFAATGLGW
ncbi:MAG: hypothetical protein BGO95_10800 [Micrococcales bacterium 73-13]|nr:MAG: hypothetical protein BGO95_10800 [Micrococcales bacterium 73-13]